MIQHVCLEGTIPCEGEVALFANKRLLSRMCPHVPLEVTSFDAGEVTLLTPERLLS